MISSERKRRKWGCSLLMEEYSWTPFRQSGVLGCFSSEEKIFFINMADITLYSCSVLIDDVNSPNFCYFRPNEIIIYESTRFNGRLFERKRLRGRFVHGASASDERYVSLDMADFRRIGGGRDRVRTRAERSRENLRNDVSPRAQSTRHRPYRDHRHRESRREILDIPPSPVPSPLRVDVAVPQKLSILLDSPDVSKQESLEHAWSATDKSFNIVLKEEDPRVMRRHPIAQSTDCIRGKQGYSSGLHMWQACCFFIKSWLM